MKKIFCIFLALILFYGTANAAVSNKKGTITASTNAEAEIAPNIAEISFAVITSNKTSMQTATNENKNISEKVLTELKSVINENNGDYIKTADFNATPIYVYNNSKKIFDKYEVSNKVIVHTKSINNIGQMIDKAINAGATKVENLSFTVTDYEPKCNELITIASQKAQSRAKAAASALGTSLDGIENLVTSCSANNYNQPRFYMAKNMVMDAAAESFSGGNTPISNGVIKINANVNASFFVK